MHYEFAHTCDGLIITQIEKLCGKESYFLICMGHLNYFYCKQPDLIKTVKEYLKENRIALHDIPEADMRSILNSCSSKEYQIFHGNPALFKMFQKTMADHKL